MEKTSWVPYLIACLATLALILLALRLRRRRKLNLPPGPKPWPIIGNLNLIGPLPHQSLHALSRKYGPIMQLKFGSFPVIVASSAEMAKALLKTNDAIFTDRPKTAAGKYTTYNYSDITWSSYGPYWRQARKMCLMELFSAKCLESFEYIRREERKMFLQRLYESCGTPIVLKDHLLNLNLNVISRMVFGKKYTEGTGENEIVTPKEFMEMLNELFLLNGVLDIGDSIPWLSFLDLQGHIKRMKALAKKLDRFLEHVLDEHNVRRQGVKDYVAQDMLDVLLQLSEDPNLEVKLERDGVKAFSQDIIAAGTDSSSVMVEWAISELLKKPDILAKATAELDRVIGRERWVEEEDMVHLPYINSIAKEAMRLHPVAPMLVPRVARQDCLIAGYDVPKGTMAFVSVWTIGRDPNLWNHPTEFCPDRFIGKTIDVKGHDFELLPFGSGRRKCPGFPLAIKVIQTSLANVLHGFHWQLPENTKPDALNMEEIFGLSTPKRYHQLKDDIPFDPLTAPHRR